jgi:phosphate butyryltransferase
MKSFDEIIAAAQKIGPKRLAIAGRPNDELEHALAEAVEMRIATPVIFETAPEAVAAVKSGQADALMKGSVDTPVFMRAVLDHDNGLRSGQLVSHVIVMEALGRLWLITDSGIVPNPTLEEKARIITNAVPVANALGIDTPKVAVLAAIEKENPKMPETLDAAALSKMNLPGCVVQGPLALDNAVSVEAARTKGITGPVAGRADIMLVPSVVCGNIFVKGLMYFSNCRVGGCVAGTSRPVTFLSRADTAQTKLNTIALGILLSERNSRS